MKDVVIVEAISLNGQDKKSSHILLGKPRRKRYSEET
jgi:hypothetical protein